MPKDPRIPALVADHPDMPPNLRNALMSWNDYAAGGGSADSESGGSVGDIPGSARRAANRVNKADSSADLVAPAGSTGRGWVFPAAGAGKEAGKTPPAAAPAGSAGGPTNAQNAANAAKTNAARQAASVATGSAAKLPPSPVGAGGAVTDRGGAIARARLADRARILAAKVPPDPAAGFASPGKPAAGSIEAAMGGAVEAAEAAEDRDLGESLPDEDDPSEEIDAAIGGMDIGALLDEHFRNLPGDIAATVANPLAGVARMTGRAAETAGLIDREPPPPGLRGAATGVMGGYAPPAAVGYAIGELLDEYFGANPPAPVP